MIWASGYGWIVGAATWGTLVVELLLATGIRSRCRRRNKLLILGILFHFAIAFVFGLWTFSLAMSAALLLYLRQPDQCFRLALRPLALLSWIEQKKATLQGEVCG